MWSNTVFRVDVLLQTSSNADKAYVNKSGQRSLAPRTFLSVIDGEIVPEYIRRSEDLKEMGLDHPLHNLVYQCVETIPEDRPSAAEIIETLQKFSTTVEGKSSGCFLFFPLVLKLTFKTDASFNHNGFDDSFEYRV